MLPQRGLDTFITGRGQRAILTFVNNNERLTERVGWDSPNLQCAFNNNGGFARTTGNHTADCGA